MNSDASSFATPMLTQAEQQSQSQNHPSLRWYVIRTLPNQENLAEANLKKQGFRTFIPRTLSSVKHARKTSIKRVSLFPRYGFVQLDLTAMPWRSINSTYGVEQLILGRDMPLPVPDGVVEDMMFHADMQGIVNLSHGLAVGKQAKIRVGPFSGLIGTLTNLDKNGRVELLLKLLNNELLTLISRDMLEIVR